jgi:DNA-binding winged helix-turn-helix (wHTH) protein
MQVAIGDTLFDSERRQLLRGGAEVRLSPKAFRLLEVLLERRPKALSKADLCDTLWPDTFVVEANLANLVRELREALGDDARKPRYLRTVHGFGYAFAEEARARGGAALDEESAFVFRAVCGPTEIDLRPGENVFGRDRHAHVWLSDDSVSRRHARITVVGDQATLEDLGSKNGTFRRDERITSPVALGDGDAFAIGSVAMTLRRIRTDTSTVTRTGRAPSDKRS